MQQIRQEIEERGLTDYRIAKDTGIPLSTVQRIRAGADARGANIDKLLAYLGFQLVVEKSSHPAKSMVASIQTMIATKTDYEKAQEELRSLEQRLQSLQQQYPVGSKGFTKAGIHKLIARLHEELAIFEGSEEARQTDT